MYWYNYLICLTCGQVRLNRDYSVVTNHVVKIHAVGNWVVIEDPMKCTKYKIQVEKIDNG